MPSYKALVRERSQFPTEMMLTPLVAEGVPAALSFIARGAYSSYTVAANDLEQLFQLLNVARPDDYRLRNLSVGDVVLDLDARKAHLCAPVGWIDVTREFRDAVEEDPFIWDTTAACPVCLGRRYIHAECGAGPEIQRCENCATVTDEEAVRLHERE